MIRFVKNGYEKVLNSTKIDDMYKVLSQSDIVSLHCPLNDTTQGMVDENFIKQMRKRCKFSKYCSRSFQLKIWILLKKH